MFQYQVKYGSSGFPYVDPEPEAYVRVDHSEEGNGIVSVSITGNREGLLLLAKYLISLADFQGPPEYHFHLDPFTPAKADLGSPTLFLEEDSDALILYKRDRPL